MLNKKNRFYKNFKRHGYKTDDKDRLDAFRTECHKALEMAKLSHMTNVGNILDNPNTPQKSYWKLINRVMSISKAPKIPPLIVNNLFVLNYKEKAIYFNEFFSEQCKTIVNSSVLPVLNFHTEKRN